MNLSDILKELAQNFPALATLIAVLFSVSAFLDWKLQERLKGKFLSSVYGEHSSGAFAVGQLPSYYAAIHSLFGLKNFSSFFARSLLATVLMIAILSALQALINPDGFQSTTLPFLWKLLSFNARAFVFLCGVIFVDLISIYQTVTFLRISRGCQNFWEIAFLGIADLLISVLLFIVIFPLFVTAGFFIHAPKNRTFPVVVSSNLTKQNSGIAALGGFLAFDPRSKDESSTSSIKDLMQRKWQFRSYDVSIYRKRQNDPTLSEAISGGVSAGSFLVQTRGNISDSKVIGVLWQILRARPYISSLAVLESVDNFYSAHALARVSVENLVTLDFFWSTYGRIVKQINFLDDELFNVLKLQSPSVTVNDIAFQYNLGSANSVLFDENREQYVYCDGSFAVVSRGQEPSIKVDYDSCETAVAIDSIALRNLRSLGLYEDSSDAIPISPLALSSLTATFVIYYLLISRAIFRIFRRLFAANFKDGEVFLTRHLFTITTTVGIFIVSPLLALMWSVL